VIPRIGIPIVRIAIPLVPRRTRRRPMRGPSTRHWTRHWTRITAHGRWGTNGLGHTTPCSGHTASVDETIKYEEDDKTAHAGTKANDKRFVVANPSPDGRTLALAAIAFTAGVTRRTIQIILEHRDTGASGIPHDTASRATDKAAGRV
jgi:hypothetical protein